MPSLLTCFSCLYSSHDTNQIEIDSISQQSSDDETHIPSNFKEKITDLISKGKIAIHIKNLSKTKLDALVDHMDQQINSPDVKENPDYKKIQSLAENEMKLIKRSQKGKEIEINNVFNKELQNFLLQQQYFKLPVIPQLTYRTPDWLFKK